MLESKGSGGSEHNLRVYEVQAAGTMSLDDWYALPVWERTCKVAVTMIPNLFAYLNMKQDQANALMNDLRAKAGAK